MEQGNYPNGADQQCQETPDTAYIPYELAPADQTLHFLDTLLHGAPTGVGLHAYVWRLAGKRTTSWPVGAAYPEILSDTTQRPTDLYVGATLARGPLPVNGSFASKRGLMG